jgi:hypothetical protein
MSALIQERFVAEPLLKKPGDIKALKLELMDLKITNRGKDYFIEQLQKEREAFANERQGYVENLMSFHRKVGELETRLLQLRGPGDRDGRRADC